MHQTYSWLIISAIQRAFAFLCVSAFSLIYERNTTREILWYADHRTFQKANNNSQSQWMWFCASVAVGLIISAFQASGGLSRCVRKEMSDGAGCHGTLLCGSAFVFGKSLNSEQSTMSPSQYDLHIVSKWPFRLAWKSVNFIILRRETSGADQIYILFSCWTNISGSKFSSCLQSKHSIRKTMRDWVHPICFNLILLTGN